MKRFLLTILLVLVTVSAYAFDFGLSLNFAGGQKKCTDLLPIPGFTPTSVAFGNHSTGTTTDSIVTLSNVTGTAPLSGAELAVSGTSFTLQSTTCGENPFDLAAGADCTATVRFAPLTASEFTGSLDLTAPNFDGLSVSLSGTGVAPASAFDDFATVGDTLGANWTTVTGMGVLKVLSNGAAVTTNNTVSVSYWSGTDLTNDHCSQIKIGVAGSKAYAVRVRQAADANTAYEWGTTQVIPYIAGVAQGAVVSGLTSASGWIVGDELKLCINGTAITAYKNGVLEGSGTSATIATGYPAFRMRYNDDRVDRWDGGVAP